MIELNIVTRTEIIDPNQTNKKRGWLFWITPSISWNAFKNSLSSNFEIPGITTIAKTRVMPATKEHNSADEIKDISNIFTLFPLNSYPITKPFIARVCKVENRVYK